MRWLPFDLNRRIDPGEALAEVYAAWEAGITGYDYKPVVSEPLQIELAEDVGIGKLLHLRWNDTGRIVGYLATQSDKTKWANAAALESGRAGNTIKVVVHQGYVPVSTDVVPNGLTYFLGEAGGISANPGAITVQPIAIGCGSSYYFSFHRPYWR